MTSQDQPQASGEPATRRAEFAARVRANQRQLTTNLRATYDFIVCGSGSAGSVVARRLAENPDVSVLLLEAGGDDEVPEVMEAGKWPTNLGSERDWGFSAIPNPRLNGRAMTLNMGRVLGGGSGINAMIWAHGHKNDHKTLAIVSIGSNSVTFLDTATNHIKHITYVGRAPHEAFFTPDGSELWVTVRGEDYVSVIDSTTYLEKARIQVGNGPGMTIFRPDGKYGFVCCSFTPETKVVDVKTHEIVATVPQASPFG